MKILLLSFEICHSQHFFYRICLVTSMMKWWWNLLICSINFILHKWMFFFWLKKLRWDFLCCIFTFRQGWTKQIDVILNQYLKTVFKFQSFYPKPRLQLWFFKNRYWWPMILPGYTEKFKEVYQHWDGWQGQSWMTNRWCSWLKCWMNCASE